MPDWDLAQGFGAEEGDPDHDIHDPAGHCGGQSFGCREDLGDIFGGPAGATRCNRCGSIDVRWRQQGGQWVLFSLTPGVQHVCPVQDNFQVLDDDS